MIKAGVIGATGYTGITLISILLKHSQVKIEWATSESYSGKSLAEVYPHLNGQTKLVCQKMDIGKLAASGVDVVFIALPHGLAMEVAPKFVANGIRVIDLGADYRLKKKNLYNKWYKIKHKNPLLLKRAVYGLPEVYHAKIQEADLVANPGCYATAAILAGLPLVKNHLVDRNSIIVDAKSGVSGAGRSLSLTTHYTECNEGFTAYKVSEHRHTPEIEQEIGAPITFVPHLVPMNRGILVTLYAKVKKKVNFIKLYKDFYKGSPSVRVLEKTIPSTKFNFGTNYCDITAVYDNNRREVIVISAIDNLVKGASGQAVQNMNIMFGLNEMAGLDFSGIYP
jgi:N-acetyl-gamma-glutamyl-phosphate reductase